MNLQLRKATLTDISFLEEWDTQSHVVEASGKDDEVDWESEILQDKIWQDILIAELDDRPIGVVMIIDPYLESTHYWGKVEQNLRAIDIWIGSTHDLGQGYGSLMMQQALARCFSDQSVTAVLVDPLVTNTRAHSFYERHGFKMLETKRFGQDDCRVYQLDRDTWMQLDEHSTLRSLDK